MWHFLIRLNQNYFLWRAIFFQGHVRVRHRMLEVLLSTGQIKIWVSVKSSAPVWRLILKFSCFIKLSLDFRNLFIMGFVFLRLPCVNSHGIRWQRELFAYLSLVSIVWKREKINPLDKLFVNSIVSEVLKLNSSKTWVVLAMGCHINFSLLKEDSKRYLAHAKQETHSRFFQTVSSYWKPGGLCCIIRGY